MLCAKCGTSNADVDRFCAKCGTPLNPTPGKVVPTAPRIDIISVICAKCGTANAGTDHFCAKCGTSLYPAARPPSPAVPKPDSAVVSCTKCGTKNSDSDKFCAKCGTQLNTSLRPVAPVIPKPDPTVSEAAVESKNQVFCAKCGTKNPDIYKFCAKCGTALISLAVQPAPPPSAAPIAPLPEAIIMQASGVNSRLELWPGRIKIKRQDQEIDLSQVTSVEFKAAGESSNGFIQFTFSTGIDLEGGLTESGESRQTLWFAKAQQQTFEDIKKAIDQIKIQNTKIASANNGINDLEKLAELKAKGIITEEEFRAKKKQILGL